MLLVFFVGEGYCLFAECYAWAWAILAVCSTSALVVELLAVRQGCCSTLSEITWILWAEQPWVLTLIYMIGSYVVGGLILVHFGKQVFVVVSLCSLAGFFIGHFIAQASDSYEAVRRREAGLPLRRKTDRHPVARPDIEKEVEAA